MLPVTRATRRLAYTAAALASAGIVVVAGVEIPRLAWQATLQSAEREYELRSAAVSADGSAVWLAMATRPRGALSGPEQPVVTSISAAGKPTGRLIDPGDASGGTLAPRRGVIGMMAGPDRSIVLAVNRSGADPALATIDPAAAKPVASRPLSFPAGAPEIARLVELTGGRRLIVGTLGNRPFVGELTRAGAPGWQRVLEEENVNLDDGSSTADGGAVITGRKGADPAATQVWVAKLSAKGEIERQATFDGWLGAAAQGSGGGYLLVTTERARNASVTLTGLTPALTTRWTRAIPAGQPTTPPFRVAGVRGGGFIVAGVKDRGLWLSRVAEDGAAVWTEARPPAPPLMETVLNVELLSRDDTFFLLYTVFVVEEKEQRQLVRAMRFAP